MSIEINTSLDLPLEAQHLNRALLKAREIGDSFRAEEMRWLDKNNTYTAIHFQDMYRLKIDISGIVEADYFLRGCALGSAAVRLSSEESPFDYSRAINNYQNNLRSQTQKHSLRRNDFQKVYDNPLLLSRLFKDQELIDVIMSIVHPTARDATAVTLGYFCLKEIP